MRYLYLLSFMLLMITVNAQSNQQNTRRPYYGDRIFKIQIGNKYGTGFLIKDKLLVTNFHVVKEVVEALRTKKKPEKIMCASAQMIDTFQDHINFNLEAEVFEDYIQSDSIYHYSKLTDVIILDVSKNENLGDSEGIEINPPPHLNTGQEVFTIGFPLTNYRSSISKGVVGFNNNERIRNAGTSLNSITTYQTDIRTTRGGSGSPVIIEGKNGDKDKLVGIIKGGYSSNIEVIDSLSQHYSEKWAELKKENADLTTRQNQDVYEKMIIFESLLNDVGTVNVFVASRHIQALYDMLSSSNR